MSVGPSTQAMDTGGLGVLLGSVWQHLYLIIFALTAYLALGRARQYWRLRHFSGPATTGISWWWHSKIVLSGQSHRYYGHVTDKYGPIARISPEHLITSSPELWAHINRVRSPYQRASWYYHAARFEPGKDNVFTDCDNDSHDARRKKIIPGYSGKENPALESTIDGHIKELVNLVRKYALPASSTSVSKPMDLAKKIPYFTLDVISHIGLGKAFGDLVADEDVNDYLKSTQEGLKIGNTAFALGLAWLREVPIIGPAISPSEKDVSGYGRMMAEARKLVNERMLHSTESKSDMLASFIRNGVSGDDLFQEAFEQIVAGSDTTASAIRATLLYIMSHVRVYRKLQSEIDAAVESGAAPPSPDVISDTEARRLPYLCAVVREGLRMQPPAVNIFSRIVPAGGDVVTVNGTEYFLPGGTMIGYSAWSMHRNNQTLYGADAAIFRPERWFIDQNNPTEKQRLAQMTKTNDMVFGAGRWQCPGKAVALVEIHKCIFELFRHFDFTIVNPHRPWHTFNSLGLWEIKDMWVNVTLRD